MSAEKVAGPSTNIHDSVNKTGIEPPRNTIFYVSELSLCAALSVKSQQIYFNTSKCHTICVCTVSVHKMIHRIITQLGQEPPLPCGRGELAEHAEVSLRSGDSSSIVCSKYQRYRWYIIHSKLTVLLYRASYIQSANTRPFPSVRGAHVLASMRLQSNVLYYVNHDFKKKNKNATHIAWDKGSDDRFCL